MHPPVTYFEWSKLLDQFGSGDDAVLGDLEQGTFKCDAGTVYRFYNKVQEAYVGRKRLWADKFTRLFQLHPARNSREMSVLLSDASSNLKPLARFISLPAFPAELQKTLRGDFDEFVSDTRKNLRDTLSRDPGCTHELLLVVAHFKFYEMTSPSEKTSEQPNVSPEMGRFKRKFLL